MPAVTANKIGYQVPWKGSWEASLKPLVEEGLITQKQADEEIAFQKQKAKTKRNQKTESQMTKQEKSDFRKQKKKLAAPLYSQRDHAHLEKIYFERINPEYYKSEILNK